MPAVKLDPARIPDADAGRPTEAILLRFWSKVDTRSEQECWPWTRAKKGYGHGLFALAPGHNRVASRMAYIFHHQQPIPDGLVIRHSCDNPPCCNPVHLEVGTQADNVRDMHERGRARYLPRYSKVGRTNANTVINLEIANAIRVDIGAGMSRREVSAKYGVSPTTVSRVKRGESWPGY